MPIYTGKSADGSDIMEIKGMFTSPCGEFWSSEPFTREQRAYNKCYDHIAKYQKTFRELYNQIKSGSKENLPKWCRDWLINEFEKPEGFQ